MPSYPFPYFTISQMNSWAVVLVSSGIFIICPVSAFCVWASYWCFSWTGCLKPANIKDWILLAIYVLEHKWQTLPAIHPVLDGKPLQAYTLYSLHSLYGCVPRWIKLCDAQIDLKEKKQVNGQSILPCNCYHKLLMRVIWETENRRRFGVHLWKPKIGTQRPSRIIHHRTWKYDAA